jgi:undecaprenyl-diphosphatase
VLLAFYKYIIGIAVELYKFVRDIALTRLNPQRLKDLFRDMPPMRRMILLLAVSTIPLLLTYRFTEPYVKAVSEDNDIIAEGVCFLLTSILLFLSDNCIKGFKTAADMKYRDAVAIGVAQAIAPFPGISRSGSTISVSLLAGLDREYAVAFSFLMGVPPVLGANLMEISDSNAAATGIPTGLIWMGVGVAFVVGVLAIFLVKWLVRIENFRIFAWYTMILGVLTIGVGIFERLTDHMIQQLLISFLSDSAFLNLLA